MTDNPSWADDVQWVYDHLKDRITKNTPGYTSPRKAMHDWANDEDSRGNPNITKFMGDWVPKAQALKDKAGKLDDDELILHEKRSIADLKHRLAEALAEEEYDPEFEEAFKL